MFVTPSTYIMSNIDRLIPVIRVFRRRNFPLPIPAPIVENNNLSPNHPFGNNSEMDESDHENGPFYYSDYDEDLGDGEVVNDV